MSRFTPVKLVPLILSTLLLTSCSGPDSSGGVEFSKTDNSFSFGDCRGSGYQTHSTKSTGCGWVRVHERSYYLMPWADLIDANLSYTNLNWANLTNANLDDANLSVADLRNANLSNADLSGANLYAAILDDANLSGANLSGANLSAYLVSANLSGANLSNADLSWANLTHANLSLANLSGVKGSTSTICPNGINWGTSGNDCPF